jgi:hypothetical protein
MPTGSCSLLITGRAWILLASRTFRTCSTVWWDSVTMTFSFISSSTFTLLTRCLLGVFGYVGGYRKERASLDLAPAQGLCRRSGHLAQPGWARGPTGRWPGIDQGAKTAA